MKLQVKKLSLTLVTALILAACSSGTPTPTELPPTEPPPPTQAPQATEAPAAVTEAPAAATTAAEPTLVPTTVPPNATPPPLPSPSADDLAKVKSSGKLLVGVSADYPPFASYNSEYKIDGFDIGLINELAKRIGATTDINDFAFEGLLSALQLGQVDAAISAISVTPERSELVDFGNTYYIGADGVLGPANAAKINALNDLAGKRVGAQKGSVYASYLKENLVDKNLSSPTDIFLYPDIGNGVRDLKDGKLDYLMMDRLPARNFAQAEGLTVVGEGFNPQNFAIAVRNGSTLR
jgi:polar amino acid transport system substrate-binding protein